jgi:hypothetical protein
MRLSASQVQVFVDCRRKWAWKYIEGVEEPPNAAAEKGRAVHAMLEQYLSGGAIDFTTEIGYIAAAGLEHLPKPGTPGLLVEQEFHFEGPSGHSYLGYKDLEQEQLGIGIIYDHKTTSDLRWQKTPEELERDIQATLYAVDYFRKHPERPTVELRWVYYQTKNARKSAVVVARVNQADTWQRFLAIEKIAEQMHEVATVPVANESGEPRLRRALDLVPNINHCDAYGGCPHQGRCNLSPFDKMRSHVEQNKLTELLKNKNKNNGAAATPTSAAAPPAPATPTRAAVPGDPFSAGGAFHGTAAAAAATPPANKLLSRLQASGAPAAAVATPAPAAINPPEFQPPPVAAPAVTVATATPALADAGRELAESLSVPSATVAEKRGRGRPKAATVPAGVVATKIKTLYVNCGPVGVAVVDAAHFIMLAKKTIAEGGIADYRFAEYGQGPGLLAVAVASEIDALEGVLPALRLDTTTPEGSIVAVELQARAEMVVR